MFKETTIEMNAGQKICIPHNIKQVAGILFANKAEKERMLSRLILDGAGRIHIDNEQLTSMHLGRALVITLTDFDIEYNETIMQNMRFRLQHADIRCDWLARIEQLLQLAGFERSRWSNIVADCTPYEQQQLRIVYAMLSLPNVLIIDECLDLNMIEQKKIVEFIKVLQVTFDTQFILTISDPRFGRVIDYLQVCNHNGQILTLKQKQWRNRNETILAKNNEVSQ